MWQTYLSFLHWGFFFSLLFWSLASHQNSRCGLVFNPCSFLFLYSYHSQLQVAKLLKAKLGRDTSCLSPPMHGGSPLQTQYAQATSGTQERRKDVGQLGSSERWVLLNKSLGFSRIYLIENVWWIFFQGPMDAWEPVPSFTRAVPAAGT